MGRVSARKVATEGAGCYDSAWPNGRDRGRLRRSAKPSHPGVREDSTGRRPSLNRDTPIAGTVRQDEDTRGEGLAAPCRRTLRRSWALAATMIVDALIATAPTAIGRSIPQGTSSPAATGIAIRL